MASRNEIVAYLDDLLDIGSYSDYGPNGLFWDFTRARSADWG